MMMLRNNQDTSLHVDQYRARPADDITSVEESYKGLRISALPGLHDFVALELVQVAKTGSHIVDVAAGTGAMTQRLLDLGFRVTAIEYVSENFAPHERVPCHSLDLNTDFATTVDDTFAGIVAVEIIEHLENPRAFLRGLRKMLAPGGKIVLTTPNVDNPVSQAFYVRFGHFLWFDDLNVERLGHITPLGPRLLRQACADSGLKVDKMMPFGDPFLKVSGWKTMRLLSTLFKWFGRRKAEEQGEIVVAVLSAAE